MAVFSIVVVVLSAFEIWFMVKKKQKKEIIVYVFLAIFTLALGIYYFSNPYRESLVQRILNILGKEF